MRRLPSGPWWPVVVYILGDKPFSDCISGNSPLNALQNAAWNWPDAEWVEIEWHRGVEI